jgi:hypothetical protein
MFWAAMALTPLSILSSGHGPVARFVTGAASAMLVVGLVSLVRSKGCWPGKNAGGRAVAAATSFGGAMDMAWLDGDPVCESDRVDVETEEGRRLRVTSVMRDC